MNENNQDTYVKYQLYNEKEKDTMIKQDINLVLLGKQENNF